MAVFLNDTLSDTNGTALSSHTGETGATWAKHSSYAGNVSIQTNRAYLNGAALDSALYYASGTPAGVEYDIEGVIRCVSTSQSLAGVVGRLSLAADTHYRAQYYKEDATPIAAWQLEKRVAGVTTSLGSYSQALSAGVDYTVKLGIRDAAKKLYVDGVERISSADNAITAAGNVGLRLYADATPGTGVGLHIDSISTTDGPGLVVWFKADAITGLVDADPVATWVDSSGNGRDATQGTAGSRPAYKTAILNSLPIVRFDATDDQLITASVAHSIGTGNFSFYSVVFCSTASSGYREFAANGSFAPAAYIHSSKFNLYWAGDHNGSTTLSNSTWYLLYCERVGTTITYYINGVVEVATFTVSNSMADAVWRIGGSDSASGCDVAEQGLYNRALSSTDRQALESYIATKYGFFSVASAAAPPFNLRPPMHLLAR